jgi:hypothetical protein
MVHAARDGDPSIRKLRTFPNAPVALMSMATRIPRLALLLCDTPIPEVKKDYGEYPTIFGRLFRTSLPDGIADFAMDPYDVRNAKEYPKMDILDTYDGIVITGSGDVLVQFN